MNILGIETSCDETAVCLMEAEGDINSPQFTIRGNALNSQIELHKEYGGVYPALAKREHSKNLIPLFRAVLKESREEQLSTNIFSETQKHKLEEILDREPELLSAFINYIQTIKKPHIDAIAVTSGPGLEPALWVGINFVKALSYIWNIPLIEVNHMEGHIASVLLPDQKNAKVSLPALALLISGGHTELVYVKSWGNYTILGQTLDDAVGEAFDKVARLLELPYPGGPEISRLAEKARKQNQENPFTLPRPMIASDNYSFSFSGLKTAVLYTLKKHGEITMEEKEAMAQEFENAATEVLIVKTKRALNNCDAQSLIVAGGVTANTHIREEFRKMIDEEFPTLSLSIPDQKYSTDNALMIAAAGYIKSFYESNPFSELEEIVASGTLEL